MTGFEVYKCHLALTQHFKGKYNWHKYNGKTKVGFTSYERSKGRRFYDTLSKQYKNNEVIKLFIANMIRQSPPKWIGEFVDEDCKECYNTYCTRLESLSRYFKLDIRMVHTAMNQLNCDFKSMLISNTGNIPPICQMYLQEHICIETLIIFNRLTGWINKNDTINPLWSTYKDTLIRYDGFVEVGNVATYASQMKHELTENSA